MWLQRAKPFRHIKALRQCSKSPWIFSISSSYSDSPHKKLKIAPLQERKMIDRFRLYAKGGSGGSGCSSTRRSRHDRHGIPDGGNGGRGGDVILECSTTVWDFSGLQPHLIAQRGGHGSSKNKIGTRGADKVAQVPIGTVIHLMKGEIPFVAQSQVCKDLDPWELPGTPIDDVTGSDQHSAPSGPNMAVDTASSSIRLERIVDKAAHMTKITQVESTEVPTQSPPSFEMCTEDETEEEEQIQYNVAELTVRGQRLVIAHGAEGGLGSVSLKVPKKFKTDPLDAQVSDDDQLALSAGMPGSEAVLILELKSIADVSLVGMPNAGKSTLLGGISRAKPAVGHYAFTTLRPNLGNLNFDDFSLTVADVPGLIKGAGKASQTKPNIYCVYDSQLLTSFTSSLYLAGLAASLVASRLAKIIGRRNIMLLGGSTFLVGSALNGGAVNVAMLILGRILLGFGVGFTNQSAPIYLSEVAPPKWRGAFSTGFQFFIGIGVLAANCINYATAKQEHGWRISLGLAIVPAAIMTFGALFITDSPSSLVQRNKFEQAKKALINIRGKDTDIEPELALLIKNSEIAKAIDEEPFMTIFQRQYRPQLVIGMIAIPFFQQVTGINIIAFYAPVLFQSVGFGNDSALIAAIILGMVNIVSILVSTYTVDRYGRRFLFMEGGIQMFITQVGVAIVLAITTGTDGTKHISKGYAILVLVLMCLYAAGFGWSWGPLSWLIPSEIFPMKIRSTGQSMGLAMNFATTFVLSQTFLSMLCHFKYGTFLFYGAWIFAMTIFVALFLPETKGIPLDSVHTVWEKHWYWRRFVQSSIPEDTINHEY